MQRTPTNLTILTSTIALALTTVGFAGGWHTPSHESSWNSPRHGSGHGHGDGHGHGHDKDMNVQLGPRPYFVVDQMDESELKSSLEECSEGPFEVTDFSIGHRGAALQFPEHTKESYEAAARMGAGIIECDVTFTKDRELVCRHSQCDLHTTTNILAIPELAAKCTVPFTPADPETGAPATAQCCTSDITLDEFKSLCGKMDASNPNATSVAEYLGGTPDFRTDLYATCGTVMTHAESIALIKGLGASSLPNSRKQAWRCLSRASTPKRCTRSS